MDWVYELFTGQGIASSILKLALVIAAGVAVGRLKFRSLSLGVTGALFVGIFLAHCGMRVPSEVLGFVKEFGLILFVYAVGMQVGPGFFSTFKHGGVKLNVLAALIIILGCLVTYAIYLYTGTPIATMAGVMSGAVTNTPALGAVQQANFEMTGIDNPDIAAGYAVAYPLAVLGTIASMLFLYYVFRINAAQEEREAVDNSPNNDKKPCFLSLKLTNKALHGLSVNEIHQLIKYDFIITRVKAADNTVRLADGDTVLELGDNIFIVTSAEYAPTIVAFIGEKVTVNWNESSKDIVSRDILVTRPEINSKTLSQLRLRSIGVNVTRIKRIGIDFVAVPSFPLQIGDQVTVVGMERAVETVAEKLGNSIKRLNYPNLFQIFLGIALGIIVGSIPVAFPGISQPVKLGLAGGPLIVAILLSRFGFSLKVIMYTTESATMMLRDVGIALFLASVGLSVGGNFIEVIVGGGYKWIGYGVAITVIPLLIVGVIARRFYRMNYFTLCGLIAGAMTDAPALAIVNEMSNNDIHSTSYATVYPMTMFLRVLLAQMMILLLA